MNKKLITLCALLTAPLLQILQADVPLVREGKPVATIIATPGSANDAAKILAAHIQQMSGADLPILPDGALENVSVEDGRLVAKGEAAGSVESFVLIGFSPTAERMGFDLNAVGPGGVLIQTKGNVVGIFGRPQYPEERRQDGDERAVYMFLERLGFRYLWPGEVGKVVPKSSEVVVQSTDVRFTPKIGQRKIRFFATAPRKFEDGLALLRLTEEDYKQARSKALETVSPGDWGLWNGLGGNLRIGGGHAGYGLKGGWEEHGEEHPEWFAQQPDGSRDQAAAGKRWRACVSNPELIDYVANSIIESLNGQATDPISLAPNDGGFSSYCMCEECKKLDPPDAPKVHLRMFPKAGARRSTTLEYPSLTDRHLHYWNAIAEKVTAKVPDQKFVIDAYSDYSDAPVREKVHPSLIVRYVPNSYEAWEGWRNAGAKQIFWRPNNLHSGYRAGILKPTAESTAKLIKQLADGGMIATDMQGIYNFWATQGLEYYVAARYSWDPDQDFDALLKDYTRAGFGAAAPDIEEYFRIIGREVPAKTKDEDVEISQETLIKLRALLDKAAAAVKEDKTSLERVNFLRAGFELTTLTNEVYRLANAAQAGAEIDIEEAKALMQRRWNLMRAAYLRHNLAVNTPLVAAFDDAKLARFLGGAPSSEQSKDSGNTSDEDGDDWLYEDQSETRR